MRESFGGKKIIKEEKKVDSSSFYKKLESQLVSHENDKTELEMAIKKISLQIVQLEKILQPKIETASILKVLSAGMAVGIIMGVGASWFTLRELIFLLDALQFQPLVLANPPEDLYWTNSLSDIFRRWGNLF
jgi:hypothetical protein